MDDERPPIPDEAPRWKIRAVLVGTVAGAAVVVAGVVLLVTTLAS